MSDVKPVAWGLFARVDGKFVLQHPVRFSREYCERDVKMYGPDLVWNIQPLIAGGEVTALQAEIEALRKDAERLDYLANDMQDMTFNGVDVLDFIEEDCDWPKAWRKALDAAIAKEQS